MEAHGIGEAGLEEVIVFCSQTFHDRGQGVTLLVTQVRHPQNVTFFWKNHCFEGPY